jgi:TatD DNase family protein
MTFTDSHAHLPSVADKLGAEALRAILESYAEAGAAAAREGRTGPLLLDPGTEPGDLPGRIALLEGAIASGFLRLAAGIWPSAENLASPARSLAALESAIGDASRVASSGGDARAAVRIAAIGEGGLDYHHMEGSKAAQFELFSGQLDLASRLGLPMIVHSREAAADTLALIAAARPGPASLRAAPILIHCFGYGPEEARAFLDAGCWISFAGNLTYKGSEALRAALALVPEERLLLETDSPYMNPMPRRGKPSSPVDIERTFVAAAEIRGLAVEALAERVSGNARLLFG